MLPNIPDFAVVYYGVLRAGGVVVPMNPMLKAREVAYYLSDSGAAVMFGPEAAGRGRGPAPPGGRRHWSGRRTSTELTGGAAAAGVVDRDGSDTAVDPVHLGDHRAPQGRGTHPRQPRPQRGGVRRHSAAPHRDDVVFGGLPLFHSFGQTCTLNSAVTAGACLTLLPRFDPAQALQLIADHRVTVFAGVPTMYGACWPCRTATAYDAVALRVCVSGGAALPVEVLRAFEAAFGCTVLEGYGLSETSPVASFNHPDRERKPGSIGTPIDGVEMRVVDDRRQRGRAGRGRRDRDPRPQHDEGLLAAAGGDRGGDPGDGGSSPATSAGSTRTATTSSSTGRRT